MPSLPISTHCVWKAEEGSHPLFTSILFWKRIRLFTVAETWGSMCCYIKLGMKLQEEKNFTHWLFSEAYSLQFWKSPPSISAVSFLTAWWWISIIYWEVCENSQWGEKGTPSIVYDFQGATFSMSWMDHLCFNERVLRHLFVLGTRCRWLTVDSQLTLNILI